MGDLGGRAWQGATPPGRYLVGIPAQKGTPHLVEGQWSQFGCLPGTVEDALRGKGTAQRSAGAPKPGHPQDREAEDKQRLGRALPAPRLPCGTEG